MTKIKNLLILTLLLAVACSPASQSAELDTGGLIGERESLTHIRMLDGNSGEARIFAPGTDFEAALAFIESLDGQTTDDQAPRAGYLYWMAGYRAGAEAFRLTFAADALTINENRYQLDRDVASELDSLFDLASYGSLLDAAMADLAAERGVPVDAVSPLAVEAYTFPDASLGVPEEDMFYAQVLTPGYILTLSVGDDVVIYHAAGERIVQVPD